MSAIYFGCIMNIYLPPRISGCQRNHCRGQIGQSNEDLIRAAEEGNVKRLKCLLQHRHVNVSLYYCLSKVAKE